MRRCQCARRAKEAKEKPELWKGKCRGFPGTREEDGKPEGVRQNELVGAGTETEGERKKSKGLIAFPLKAERNIITEPRQGKKFPDEFDKKTYFI